MSSHREAPEIAEDPVADSTDVYAFVSPDKPDTVTLIANYVPLQAPAGGPNFYQFGEDVLYAIHIDNTGDGRPDVTYAFNFKSFLTNENTFLYNTGPITSLDADTWNRRQTYSVRRIEGRNWLAGFLGRGGETLGENLASPPCNIGPLSTPNYADLADAAIHDLGGGRTVFAGQRAEGFYVDLGSIFDLGQLRPFNGPHNDFGLSDVPGAMMGVNATDNLNVHSIALQVPISDLTEHGRKPSGADDSNATIGVWTSASRRKVRILGSDPDDALDTGPYVQVSRLGNPLFNEVIVPISRKDYWNTETPDDDEQFAELVRHPELAKLLPVLYPGVFPNLAELVESGAPRADLVAVLLTGIPKGVVPGFTNFTGKTQADELRLNTAVPPKPRSEASINGLLGGDAAGFPNGRRVYDDVVAIELRAIAGATYALVADYTPDPVVPKLDDDVTPEKVSAPYLDSFPYLGTPYSGYFNPAPASA